MPTSKLTLCMIARNAESTIETALDSVIPYVDHVVVVYAGESTDKTRENVALAVDRARKAAGDADAPTFAIGEFYAPDYPEAFFEDGTLSDFAAARNYALSLVPEGSHWFYIDADDELIDGEKLADGTALLDKGAGVVAMTYNYAHDDYGKPTMTQPRIVMFNGRITDWQWRDRVHEWCHTAQDAPMAKVKQPTIEHRKNPDDSHTQRNLRILKLMEETTPANRRINLHIGDSYQSSEQWELALDAYARAHNDAEIEPQRYYAACQAAKMALKINDANSAAQWSMVAIDMRPMFKDGYLLRAQVGADLEDWEGVLIWLDMAADKMENTNDTAVSVWAADYKWNVWNVQYTAMFQLKRFDEAIAVARLALQEYEDNGHWWREFNVALEARRIEQSIKSYAIIADHFCMRGDTLNAWDLLKDENLPMTIRQDERIIALRERIWSFVRHVFEPEEYKKFYTSEVAGHEINGTSIDKYRLQPLVDSLKGRKATRILEVGTGAGGPAIWMLRQLPDVVEYVGIDINPDLVKLANEAAAYHGVADRLHFECTSLAQYVADHPDKMGSMGMINRPKAYFDACLLLEIVEHMLPQDAHTLVTEAEGVAEAVMLTTPAMFCSDIPSLGVDGFPRDHVKEWSLSDMEQLIFKVPRRRPVHIYRAYAPERDDTFTHILSDKEEVKELVYTYPGFACWIAEFDNQSRHNAPVTIYCGAGPGWSPLDLATKGLGGAETMAMKMAEQFAKNGHPVAVYADWVGVFNGVIYRHYSTFKPEKPYLGVDTWLFISSRVPGVFDEHINADIKWLWEHDVDAGSAEITDERLAQIDRILLLSEWHKAHWLEVYPQTPEDKIAVTRNAIDPADFAETRPVQKRHRFVWPSSPDRGLDLVLDWWPKIMEMWPDAELHVFYGFDTIDSMSSLPGRQWLPVFKQKIIDMAKQPGVFLRGRVNQRTLHDEMAQSQFWLYPSKTAFEWAWNETYCIAAVEAMAVGVTPIVADTGALRERLEEFGLADGLIPWGAPRKAWLKALKAHDVLTNAPELARRWELAQMLSFENLYSEWMRLVMESSVHNARNGRHNLDVVSQTS